MATKKANTTSAEAAARGRRPTPANDRTILDVDRDIKKAISEIVEKLDRGEAHAVVEQIISGFEKPSHSFSHESNALLRRWGARFRVFAAKEFADHSVRHSI